MGLFSDRSKSDCRHRRLSRKRGRGPCGGCAEQLDEFPALHVTPIEDHARQLSTKRERLVVDSG
jgi:hypothetical protein